MASVSFKKMMLRRENKTLLHLPLGIKQMWENVPYKDLQITQNVKTYDYIAYTWVHFLVPVVWSAETHLRSSLPSARISPKTNIAPQK